MRGIQSTVAGRVVSVALSLVLAFGQLGAGVGAALATEPSPPAVASSPSPQGPTVVRELTERRTATATHYLLSDGRQRAVISAAPTRFKDGSGSWTDIDTSLRLVAPGVYRSAATSLPVRFSAEGSAHRPVTVEGDGWQASLDLIGGTEDTPIALGDTAHYFAVGKNTDLTYQVLGDGLKETIVLDSADAPARHTFFLSLTGASIVQRESGEWAIQKDGAVVAHLGAVTAFDSSSRQGEPSYCPDAEMEVTPVAGGAMVSYSVSRAWLDDPARVFPVMIDPTIKSSLDTWMCSGAPTTAYGSLDQLRVGHASWMGYARSAVWFDVSSLKDSDVSAATFSTYCLAKGSSNNYTNLSKITSAWSESSTWNTKPTHTYIESSMVSAIDTWLDFSVTATVKEWTRSTPITNSGFGLYQPEDGTRDSTFWRYFAASEYADSSKRPKLVVDYNAAPDAVTSLTVKSTSGLDWWRASTATAVADIPRAGRGSVEVTWTRPARAQGYRIAMYDGNTYRTVANIPDARTTSWNSADARIHLSDTEISKLATDTTSDPFTRARTPADSTSDASLNVTGTASTGVVVTDGSYLYTRPSSTYSSNPGTWTRVGNGIESTAGPVQIGAASPAGKSGFYLDGVLYNGYATDKDTVKGVWKGASPNGTATVSLNFSKPLLAAWSGAELTGASADVLLASDGERIFSCSSSLSGGGTDDGYRIREFTRDGTWVSDHVVPVTLAAGSGGVFCDDGALYFMEWANAASTSIDKISTNSFSLLDRHSITQNANVLGGCYDEANNRFFLGQKSGSAVVRYLGPGLDLRDDPGILYRRTAGTQYDNDQRYFFRVVPYNDYGTSGSSASTSSCNVVTPILSDRSLTAADDPRHTTEDLGAAAGHGASALLDTGELELSVDDLALTSYGPEAAVSRVYRSDITSSSSFATGWRFDFEQTIETSATTRTWIDASGDRHVFSADTSGTTWIAPPGLVASLTVQGGATSITFKDKSTVAFDGSGRLASETDRAGDRVTYASNAEDLLITAANGRVLTVDRDVTGRVLQVSDGTRTVTYTGGTTPRVTWFPGTGAERIVEYGYTSGLLGSVRALDVPSTGLISTTTFIHTAANLTEVRNPAYPSDPYAKTTIAYSGRSATISRSADVSGTPDVTVSSTLAWNPNNTTATRTEPKIAGEQTATWTYTYAPSSDLICETSPTGAKKVSVVDATGNLLYDYDEAGHRSAYAYNADGDCVRETDPRGATTYRTFDASGNVTVEQRVLATDGARAATTRVYGPHGLASSQVESVSATDSITTRYVYDVSGQVASQTVEGVQLSVGATPVNVTTRTEFDTWGNPLRTFDASGSLVTSTTYDVAGRATEAADAFGVVTHTKYDRAGNTIESWQSAEGTTTKAGWTKSTFDASGRAVSEQQLLSDGTVVATTSHSFDASGREIGSDSSVAGGLAALTYFDARGNATRSWAEGVPAYDTAHASRTDFDINGRETTTYAPGTTNVASSKTYFPGGEIKCETLADGTYTEYAYDDGGIKVSEVTPTDGGTATKTYVYDTGARLIAETDAGGATVAHAYDLLGRETGATGEGPASGIVYNALGQGISKTDADGIVTKTTYDLSGRVVREDTVAGAVIKTTRNTYDAAGHLLSTTDPDGRIATYTLDDFGRTIEELHTTADGTVKHVTSTLDSLGRPTHTLDSVSGVDRSLTYPINVAGAVTVRASQGGVDTTITLTPTGEESSRASAWAGGSLSRSVVSTDAAGRETAWTVAGKTSTRSFDAGTGQLTGYSAPGVSATLSYTAGKKSHDALTGPLGSSGTLDITYTDDGRLDRVISSVDATRVYGFDAAGNLTTETVGSTVTKMVYDPATQRLLNRNVGGSVVATYTFNALGQRVSQGPVSKPTSETFGYTGTGRLASYATSLGVSATYGYDANGQRVRSVVTSGSLNTTTTWGYEGLSLLSMSSQRSDGATWSVTYLNDAAGRPFAGVYRSGGASATAFGILATDRGDVVALTDVSGAAFAGYRYDTWGKVMSASTQAVAGSLSATLAADIASRQPLRYAGYCYDAESSTYYLSARQYDPVTRQFLTKDPAKADGEESAYQYCGGDPVGKVDPSGMVPSSVTRHTIATVRIGGTHPTTFKLNLWGTFNSGIPDGMPSGSPDTSGSYCHSSGCHDGDEPDPNRNLQAKIYARRTDGPERKLRLKVQYRRNTGNWYSLTEVMVKPTTNDIKYLDKRTAVLYNNKRPNAARLYFAGTGVDASSYKTACTVYH